MILILLETIACLSVAKSLEIQLFYQVDVLTAMSRVLYGQDVFSTVSIT